MNTYYDVTISPTINVSEIIVDVIDENEPHILMRQSHDMSNLEIFEITLFVLVELYLLLYFLKDN